jgi:hypothetical protein
VLLVLAAGRGLAAEGESAKPTGPTFVNLPPIVLPVFEGRDATRQASIVLTLELAKGANEAAVKEQQPRLVDAFVGDLYQLYEQRAAADRVIDPGLIKPKLQQSADRVLGAGVVSQVLIQQAFERARRL